MHWNK